MHDTLEDTLYTAYDLEKEYGTPVLDGVSALTKNPAIEKELQMIDSLNRIKLQPKEIWAVKMADRICNLYAPPYYWDKPKKEKYLDSKAHKCIPFQILVASFLLAIMPLLLSL